jgi:hypothetical protein
MARIRKAISIRELFQSEFIQKGSNMILTKSLRMAVATFAIATSTAFAADTTYNFESDNITNNGFDIIPGLELNGVIRSTFSIVTGDNTSSMPFQAKEVKNFKLNFDNAPSLNISSLKRVDNGSINCPGGLYNSDVFFGTVNNAWIFRTVEVTLCTQYAAPMPYAEFSYQVTVKDMDSYTSGMIQPGQLILAEGNGTAFDKTPNKVVDTAKTNVDSKTLRLSLLQRISEVEIPNYGPRFGFVINASWLGHGDKPLVLDFYPATEAAKAIAIVLTTMPGPIPEEDIEMISVRFVDETGMEQQTTEMELRYVLEQSYGPLPLPMP